FYGAVVSGVGLFAALEPERAYLGQRVDPDKPWLLDRLAPCLDVLEAAFVYASPFRTEIEPVRPLRLALYDLFDPPMQPTLVVLEREIERIAMNRPRVTEHKATFVRYGQAHLERQP